MNLRLSHNITSIFYSHEHTEATHIQFEHFKNAVPIHCPIGFNCLFHTQIRRIHKHTKQSAPKYTASGRHTTPYVTHMNPIYFLQ